MAELADIGNALIASLESALSLTVVKGNPDWARPAMTPPIAALLVDAHQQRSQRVSNTAQDWSWTLGIFADHEPQLWAYAQDMADWLRDVKRLDVSGEPVRILFADATRHINETGLDEEQHGLIFTFVTAGD